MPGYGQLLLSEPKVRGRGRQPAANHRRSSSNSNVHPKHLQSAHQRAYSLDSSLLNNHNNNFGPDRNPRQIIGFSPYPMGHQRKRSTEIATFNEPPPSTARKLGHSRTLSLPPVQLPPLSFLPPVPEHFTARESSPSTSGRSAWHDQPREMSSFGCQWAPLPCVLHEAVI
jgi:hypothetical protein